MQIFRTSLLSLAVTMVAASCGNPPTGVMNPSILDGAETLSRVEGATTMGLVLCLARTGRAGEFGNRYQFSTVVASFQGIDSGRAYRENDVKMCADTLQIAIALDPACTYAAYNCRLNAVNKLSGGN